MKKEQDFITPDYQTDNSNNTGRILGIIGAILIIGIAAFYYYYTDNDLATEQFKNKVKNLDFKDAAVSSVKSFEDAAVDPTALFVRDSIAVKQALRQKQIEALAKVDIANAERIITVARHKVILENEHMHMERTKLQALAHAKQTMYEGLIKKLDEQANDETLSFNHLLKKYEEQLLIFKKDFLKIEDDGTFKFIVPADDEKVRVMNHAKRIIGVEE